MHLRNRMLALVGSWKLGVDFAAVLKMLPEGRRAAVQSNVEALRGEQPERIANLRAREQRRIGRAGRRRHGSGWSRLDPRVVSAILMKSR